MRMTVPDAVIPADDPFRGDALGRKPFAAALLSLVQRIDEPLVIALDALWGEGKTTFIRMWQRLLQQASGQSLYIDAFATDALDSPFTVLTGEIAAFCGQHGYDHHLGKLTETAGPAFAATLPLREKLGSTPADTIPGAFRREIAIYQSDKEHVQTFRTHLEALALSVRSTTGLPLVIVVDELDRCKPGYALSFIELIRHVFASRNIVFILSLNKQQLLSSINHTYGLKDDSNDFFNKFISLEITLPGSQQLGDAAYYRNAISASLERLGVPAAPALVERLADLAAVEELPLRKLNSIATHLAIFALTHPDATEATAQLADVGLLALLKVCYPRIYAVCRHGARDRSEIQAARDLDWPQVHKEVLLGFVGDARIRTLCAYMDVFHLPPEEGKARG